MSQIVLLDAGIIGLITAPQTSSASVACLEWIEILAAAGDLVFVPEIADYDVRRELLRGNKRRGLTRLDGLCIRLKYLPITTNCMRLAAGLWAEARRQGHPTASDAALDCDVILAAQAADAESEYSSDSVIATTNVAHLERYADARPWEDIPPS